MALPSYWGPILMGHYYEGPLGPEAQGPGHRSSLLVGATAYGLANRPYGPLATAF